MDDTLSFKERILAEAFKEMLIEMRRAGDESADGSVLDDMEGVVLDRGRDLLRRTLEMQLQAAAERAEQKKSRLAANAKRLRGTKGVGNGRS